MALTGIVSEIAVRTDGSCWVGTIEPDRTADYKAIYRLRRLTATGQIDASFQETSFSYSTTTPSLSVQSDGRVVVAGGFELRVPTGEEGREAVHTGVVRLMGDGSVDPTFAPPAHGWSRWRMLPDGTHAMSGLWRMNLSTLGVIEPPRILRMTPAHVAAMAGEDVTVRVVAVGPSPIQIGGTGAATTLSGDLITFHDVQGELQVVVKGPGGEATKAVTMDFSPSAPRIIEAPESIVARPGQEAVFTTLARGTYPLTCQWFRNGEPVDGSSDVPPDREGTVEFSRYAVTAADAGTYSVRFTNSLGTIERSATLKVGPSSELANLSVRAMAGTGDDVMIVGFVLKNRK